MKSNPDPAAPLDDIPFSPADREAMRRSAESSRQLSGAEYLRFLEDASANVELSRGTSAGWAPFDLRDGGASSGLEAKGREKVAFLDAADQLARTS